MHNLWITSGGSLFCLAITLLGCSSNSTAPPPPDLERFWAIYMRKDSSWPDVRQEWRGRGPEAERVLIENLVRQLMTNERGRLETYAGQPIWYRHVEELALIGPPTVPYAWEGVEVSLKRGDFVAKDRFAHFAARVAEIDDVERRYGSSTSETMRLTLVDVAGYRVDAESEAFLATVLGEDPSWQARAKAAEALARRPVLLQDSTEQALVAALADADLFVARKASMASKVHRCQSGADALVSLLERAVRAVDEETAQVTVEALEMITGQRGLGMDVAAWRASLGR